MYTLSLSIFLPELLEHTCMCDVSQGSFPVAQQCKLSMLCSGILPQQQAMAMECPTSDEYGTAFNSGNLAL